MLYFEKNVLYLIRILKKKLYLCKKVKKSIMATITLEYDFRNMQAQRTLEYILSLGFFKPTVIGKKESPTEKRKQLDNELENYLVDLSNFKFNREEANNYE